MSKSILYVKPITKQSISGSGTAEIIVDARSIKSIAFFVKGTVSAGTVNFEIFGSHDGVTFSTSSIGSQSPITSNTIHRVALTNASENWPFYKAKFTGSGATATNCELFVHGLGYGG
jgi:hypothetical protein